MDPRSVTLLFSTAADAPTLASCLEQLLRNLGPDPKEET